MALEGLVSDYIKVLLTGLRTAQKGGSPYNSSNSSSVSTGMSSTLHSGRTLTNASADSLEKNARRLSPYSSTTINLGSILALLPS